MNELAIKKHDFELAKSRLKEFSEKKEAELSIERVQTDGGFLWLGDHKVTGTELNSRLETIQNHLIDINSTNNKTIKEFREIYNALDALDKDYITSIVASIKAIEKTSNDVRNQQGVLNEHNRELKEHQNKLDSHQGEIDKIVGNIKQTVSVLKAFKEKLDGFEHLTEIDTIWSDCKNICNKIQIVSDSITKLSKKTTSEIWAATSQNKVIAEQINQIRDIKHLNEVDLMWDDINDARESFNSIEKCLHNIDNDIFKMQSQLSEMDEYVAVLKAYVHLKDIDNMWAGLENAQKDTQKLSKNIDELEKNQSIMDGFTKNNRQAITELEVFRNTIDDIGHLKDVDSMWGDINGAKQLLEVIENELQNLDDDIIEVQGGLNELDEYVGGLKKYVHLQDIDDMWAGLLEAKTDTQKLFGDIGNINDVIEKNQNDLDILNNKSIEHKEAIDELVKNQSTMATFTKNNRQAITELEMFRKTVDAIEHLKEVDLMWEQGNSLQDGLSIANNDIGILQQKALEAEKSFTEYKNQTEDVLAEFKKKIKYAYLIAGGSLGIAILEIILIMAGVI